MTDTGFDYLDVSEYPAPEPLQMALAALQTLASGRFLHFHHRQYPRLLFENLAKRDFDCRVRSGTDGCCEVFIWRDTDGDARQRALATAATYPAWPDHPST